MHQILAHTYGKIVRNITIIFSYHSQILRVTCPLLSAYALTSTRNCVEIGTFSIYPEAVFLSVEEPSHTKVIGVGFFSLCFWYRIPGRDIDELKHIQKTKVKQEFRSGLVSTSWAPPGPELCCSLCVCGFCLVRLKCRPGWTSVVLLCCLILWGCQVHKSACSC